MSRHTFDTRYQNRAVEVALGYDRRLDYFWLTIMFTDSPDAPESETIVYSYLKEPKAFSLGLGYYSEKLASLGIPVPESMFHEAAVDMICQAGNRIVFHRDDGAYVTIQEG